MLQNIRIENYAFKKEIDPFQIKRIFNLQQSFSIPGNLRMEIFNNKRTTQENKYKRTKINVEPMFLIKRVESKPFSEKYPLRGLSSIESQSNPMYLQRSGIQSSVNKRSTYKRLSKVLYTTRAIPGMFIDMMDRMMRNDKSSNQLQINCTKRANRMFIVLFFVKLNLPFLKN